MVCGDVKRNLFANAGNHKGLPLLKKQREPRRGAPCGYPDFEHKGLYQFNLTASNI